LFGADRGADMTRLIVAFGSFANVPKNGFIEAFWCIPDYWRRLGGARNVLHFV
jgi:hypothetical protein